ncbi:Cof-type HAD-IIB family hydrolase [Neobacillus sp. LXY-1]|uniref:Cof-type HAD-IIB family hydrolase n=1 Tax=Neobacillus sp. LXY-1 TaxID=3379133 RepID=UPI003EDF1BAF
MQYKAVIFDIDGTILPHRKAISSATKQAVQRLKDKNLKVIIATGRAPYFSESIVEEIGTDSMVFFNGAYVSHEGQEVYKNSIDNKILTNVFQLTRDYNHALTFLSGKDFRVSDLEHPIVREAYQHDPWKPGLASQQYWLEEDIYQLFLHCEVEEELSYQKMIPELDFRRWTSGEARTCDVNLSKSNKSVGITKLLERVGIAPDEAVAFGDGLNDIEMLSFVGMGVAMGSALDEVKRAANMVTLTAEEDGVAVGLERLGLI